MTDDHVTDDYAELRRAREQATPGPWFDDFGKIGHDDEGIGEMDSPSDGRFVAAANPSVIAALLADRDRLALERDQQERFKWFANERADRLQIKLRDLREQCAALRGSGAAEEAGRG